MERRGFPWVEQHEVRTSAGIAKLPLLIFEASLAAAVYKAPRKRIHQLLEPTPLLPVGWGPDYGTVWITCFECRDAATAPFRAMGVSIPCYLEQKRSVVEGLWQRLFLRDVHLLAAHMPVTDDAVSVLGRELWGFPAHTEGIDFRERSTDIQCELQWKGARDVALSIPRATGVSLPGWTITSYSVRDEDLIQTSMPARYRVTLHLGREASLDLGDGPVSETLRRLEVSGEPAFAFYTPRFQCQVPEGRAVARTEGEPYSYEAARSAERKPPESGKKTPRKKTA